MCKLFLPPECSFVGEDRVFGIEIMVYFFIIHDDRYFILLYI